MARKPRIHFAGAVYHVILKGLDDQLVFKNVTDRRAWEALVEDGVKRFGHSVHAYCWSKNHVQLAIQVQETPLAKIMQNLLFRYTRYFNKKNQREGALFHGRYKAILIEPDIYLNDLVRYIHNNPVRQGSSKSAAKAKWTSHAGYASAGDQPDWLTTATVLSSFGKSDKASRKAFTKFVEAGKDEGERTDLMRGSEGGRLLGGKQFTKKALKPVKEVKAGVTLNQLIKRVCREEGVKEAQLCNDSRARKESQIRQTIAYLAMELNVASLTSLANRFNRDLTTMSRNQRHFRDRLTDDAGLQKHVRSVRKQVLAG